MARLLASFVEPPHPCPYLPGRDAEVEYRLLADLSPEEYESLLTRGWRRFGPACFRPACPSCGECVSLRIPVASFAPTGSQRRAHKRLSRLRIEVGPPRADDDHVALHGGWRAERSDRRGWPRDEQSLEAYRQSFGARTATAREVSVRDGERLVAVGIFDRTPRAISAAYFFYDPSIARLSPGVGNVVLLVEMARAEGIPHVYLGYRVLGYPSMEYKRRFEPHEVLVGRPGPGEVPLWVPGEGRGRPLRGPA